MAEPVGDGGGVTGPHGVSERTGGVALGHGGERRPLEVLARAVRDALDGFVLAHVVEERRLPSPPRRR